MNVLLELDHSMLGRLWPVFRVSGVMLVAPILSSAYVPIRIRALLAAVLALIVMPQVGPNPDISSISPLLALTALQELAIGFSIGFVLRLVIEAVLLGGQILATTMGLQFATVVDANQSGTPTLSQFYIIVATLLLLATDAHLALIELLAGSFELMPIASASFGPEQAGMVLGFAGQMFASGLQLALPSVVAILMVNVSFGIVSRAAPTLNLFAVGFPIAMLVGFVVMILTIDSVYPVWADTMNDAFALMFILAGGN